MACQSAGIKFYILTLCEYFFFVLLLLSFMEINYVFSFSFIHIPILCYVRMYKGDQANGGT